AHRGVTGGWARRAPRPRLGVGLGAAAATVLAGVWLASGSSGAERPQATNTPQAAAAPERRTATAPTGKLDPPLLVGASVMLGAQEALHARLGRKALIDAAVGRYPADVAARLEAYRQSDAMPNRVVIQIGENGPLPEADLQRIREALRGVPRVVLINVKVPRTWEEDVNNTLLAVRGEWPEAVIADWNKAARRDLLYDDGIHPTPEGAKVYAQVVQDALRSPG
ncbi:MAG: hypothetical protein WKF96_23185, partial [Solirubrobacteraceae bacterium]